MKKILLIAPIMFVMGCSEDVLIDINPNKMYFSNNGMSCYIPYKIQNTFDDRLKFHVSLAVGNEGFSSIRGDVSSGSKSNYEFYTRYMSPQDCQSIQDILRSNPDQVKLLKHACEVKNVSEKDCKESLAIQINMES